MVMSWEELGFVVEGQGEEGRPVRTWEKHC